MNKFRLDITPGITDGDTITIRGKVFRWTKTDSLIIVQKYIPKPDFYKVRIGIDVRQSGEELCSLLSHLGIDYKCRNATRGFGQPRIKQKYMIVYLLGL